jgi:hypothetical protein
MIPSELLDSRLTRNTRQIYTPLQPASRPADEMDDWTVGGVPLRGRAGQPSEIVSWIRLVHHVNLTLTAVLHALESHRLPVS